MALDFPATDLSRTTGYAGNELDRAGARREDAAWIAAKAVDPACRYVLFCNDKPVLAVNADGTHDPLIARDAAEALGARFEDAVFLGVDGEAARFAVTIEADEEAFAEGGAHAVIDLRALAMHGILPPADLGLLAEGKSLASWHRRHRFCANCGSPTGLSQGGWRRNCLSCGAQHFPRTDPVVIMLVVDGENCLLGRQPQFTTGVYSALAGFVEPGETIEDAVRREIAEEAGISVGAVSYIASQPWPFPSTLMIGCFAQALTTEIAPDEDELEDCRWFGPDEARQLLDETHPDGLTAPRPLAIAHNLLKHFLEQIAAK